MYERLTKRDRYGHAYTNETIYDRGMTSEDGVHYEKHYFENETSSYDGKPIDRLCEIEDKIERGTVIALPFKIGDKVYHICKNLNTVKELEIISIEIAYNGIKFSAYAEDFTPTIFPESKIGKTVFLTRQEVEEALERNERE